MHSKIFQFFLLECIQGTKVILVLRVQRRTLFLSISNIYVYGQMYQKTIKLSSERVAHIFKDENAV